MRWRPRIGRRSADHRHLGGATADTRIQPIGVLDSARAGRPSGDGPGQDQCRHRASAVPLGVDSGEARQRDLRKLGISAAPVHRRVVAVLAFLENAPHPIGLTAPVRVNDWAAANLITRVCRRKTANECPSFGAAVCTPVVRERGNTHNPKIIRERAKSLVSSHELADRRQLSSGVPPRADHPPRNRRRARRGPWHEAIRQHPRSGLHGVGALNRCPLGTTPGRPLPLAGLAGNDPQPHHGLPDRFRALCDSGRRRHPIRIPAAELRPTIPGLLTGGRSSPPVSRYKPGEVTRLCEQPQPKQTGWGLRAACSAGSPAH